MLEEERMKQKHTVEINNILDSLEDDAIVQEDEKDKVDSLWTHIKDGLHKIANSV